MGTKGLTKELAEKLMKMEGETRGMSLKDDAAYVLAKKGRKGLRKVEEELERIGCPIRYEEIRALGFYPIGWRAISLLALQKAFGWGDKEFKELGGFAPGNSIIVKVYTKFFHSIDLVVSKSSQMWGEYFTKGEFSVPDYDIEKGYAVAELKGLDLHPVFCRVVEGYLATIIRMVVKPKEIKSQETKCTFEGQDHHQFKFTWN